jgi:hypothetical protein
MGRQMSGNLAQSQVDMPENEGDAEKKGWLGLFKSKPVDPNSEYINDEQFIDDLKQLKELRSFLTREAVSLASEDPNAVSFKGLNRLRFGLSGRSPTEDEWAKIEALTQTLFRLLPPSLRRKFILGRIPVWVSVVPIILGIAAIMSLIVAVLLTTMTTSGFAPLPLSDPRSLTPQEIQNQLVDRVVSNVGPYLIVPYVFWLVCLGGIGAIAFIGMNVLSVQDDVTFDLLNRRLMSLRIVLGAMFGLVLAIPFGFVDFKYFIANIGFGSVKTDTMQQAVMLLLPFVLGFSTPLVILVLNRFVEAVQGFFGKPGLVRSSELSAPGGIPKTAPSGIPKS